LEREAVCCIRKNLDKKQRRKKLSTPVGKLADDNDRNYAKIIKKKLCMGTISPMQKPSSV
jgi:hypothetical protein